MNMDGPSAGEHDLLPKDWKSWAILVAVIIVTAIVAGLMLQP